MSGAWIAVASAEHVRLGLAGGFMQVSHGKPGPLRRLRPGDAVAYYSPRETMAPGPPLRQFTAIGRVRDDRIEQVEMAPGFQPFRRAVDWRRGQPAAVEPLRRLPGFALAGADWGARLRFGLVAVDAASLAMIAHAMGADWPEG